MASVERPRRPASVIVLAVCQLMVGSAGIVYDAFKAGGSLLFRLSPTLMKSAADANPVAGFQMQAPYFLEVQTAASVVGFVLSIVLIADGIGLLLLRRWAYNLGVLYGWLSIVYQVVWLAFLFLVVMPVVLPAMDNMVVPPGTAQPQAFRETQKVLLMIEDGSTALGLLYPIFVLIMLAVTRKAFRRPRPAAEAAEDYGPGAAEGPDAGEEPSPGYRGEPDDRIGPARS